MKINQVAAAVSAAVVATIIIGCSPHEDTPKTPYIIATTPTYRATVNSTDPVIDPYHMTPGVNGGKKVATPSIAAPDLYNANSALAVAVYVALAHTSGIDIHYISVEGKPHSVLLQGTVQTEAQKAQIEKIARQTAGVQFVQDNIAVMKQ